MGKKLDNDENLRRYQERFAELQKNGELSPTPASVNNDLEKLIRHLVAEGEKLLKTKPAKAMPKRVEETKLTDALGLKSQNPYIRARIMVLQKYPNWRRKEIGTMEQSGNINNPFYTEFVRAVATLGDTLSEQQ